MMTYLLRAKKAGRKLSALFKISNYMSFEKKEFF